MAIFHKTHLAQLKESNHILARSKSAIDALQDVYTFCEGSPEPTDQTKEKLVDRLEVELAKLQGYRGSNALVADFVSVAEAKVQNILDEIDNDLVLQKEHARAVQIAIYALDNALQIHNGRIATNKYLYFAEMQMRQTSIESLSRTLHIAMFGLQAYFGSLALWLAYSLHASGHWWRVVIPTVGGGFVIALSLLHWAANKSIKSSSDLLASLNLKEDNA
jgi:hypothetical protein